MNTYNRPATSIAVLPFRNNSTSQELNFLALGLSEDLITDLSKYSSLQVISAHSSLAVEDKKKIPYLNADYLVKGSFRQASDKVRINAQLVLSEDESIIWSHKYDTKLDSIFDIQDDISEQLVSALQREIETNLLAATKSKSHTNLQAYEYWLMGVEELKKGSVEADNCARELFQKALDIDPNYARAYAGLSLSYFNEWSCQLWERWDYSQKGAYEYALKAVELDDTNYMSMTVLGRLYVYKGEWEIAEHYLRKSLRINSNDADNLIQVASCFIYLGYLKEAEKLYLKAMKLNPLNTGWYFSFGSMLYLEMGDFKKSVELGLKTNLDRVMVDMAAVIASSYYYLENYKDSKVYWQKYLDQFQTKIMRGNSIREEDAINWLRNVNPCKFQSKMEEFLKYMAGQTTDIPDKIREEEVVSGNCFYKNGELWEINYNGDLVMVPDAKGLHDIQKMLAAPHYEFHCSDLMGASVVESEEVLAFDDKAKKEYKQKLIQIQTDIEEAEAMNDAVRAGHLQQKYDELLDHLSKSTGLGGKTRKMSDQIEKARSALTWRIRAAIKKVKSVHEPLGNHLSNTIKTGIFCSYKPENEVSWNT